MSPCVIAKLARMQFRAKRRYCVTAKLAWIKTYTNMNPWVSATLARTGDSIVFLLRDRKSTQDIFGNTCKSPVASGILCRFNRRRITDPGLK